MRVSSLGGAHAQARPFFPMPDLPRTKPAATRRDALLDAAERLFRERGFAATSVDAIVAAAGVAKGTFYLYFKSKAASLVALQDRFVFQFRDAIEQEVSAHVDWSARLDAWITAALDGYLDQTSMHDVVFHEVRPCARRIKSNHLVIQSLALLLEGGAATGAWRTEDARLTAIMLFSALHGAADAAIAGLTPLDRSACLAAVLRFCRRVLGLA